VFSRQSSASASTTLPLQLLPSSPTQPPSHVSPSSPIVDGLPSCPAGSSFPSSLPSATPTPALSISSSLHPSVVVALVCLHGLAFRL
jgi:hypothetical protein